MDIRNWFQPKNKQPVESKKRRIDDDDDDIIPESPDVQIVNKKKRTNHTTQSTKEKNKPGKDKLKEVKVGNLFGSGPIKRTEPIVKKEAKKTETGIHSDDEFEKSLLEIDGLDQLESNDHDSKHNSTNDKSSDSQKATKHTEESKFSHKNANNSSTKTNDEKHDSKNYKSNDGQKTSSKNKEEKISSHRNDKGNSTKSQHRNTPSTSKDAAKKVEDIKKDIKEAGKRKFAEFIEEDECHESGKRKKLEPEARSSKNIVNGGATKLDNHDVSANDSIFDDSKNKKRKKSLNESVLTDEERHERKMQSAKLYQSYLNRSGPKHLGQKEMPEGAPNCLKDFAFLLTGVLDSFEREEIVETITKYGGCIKSGISKKVTHVLAGEDAGPAKMAKAEDLGIRILNEDDFLKLIKDSNENKKDKDHKRKSSKNKDDTKKSNDDGNSSKTKLDKSDIKKEKSEHKNKHKSDEREIKKIKVEEKRTKNESRDKLDVKDKTRQKSKTPTKVDIVKIESDIKLEVESKSSKDEELKTATGNKSIVDSNVSSMMWVEKHKPQTIKSIIGQQGENSNVNKLINWLTKWYVNRKAKLAKPSPWAKNDDGGYYKAVLLSGPPGVGKTTTVSLVCKQLGFDAVEFNASDTRNKTLIKGQIGELLTTTSLSAYAKGATGKQAVTKKHVLVMDEVDGMAGNEDRGGLQELIGLIKTSSVPIICMCNDRNSQKMRSLVNYCYDLRFSRPRVDQIKAAMRSICFRENIKIPPDVLEQLIVSANQDVRQTLNLLSMWAVDPSRMDPAVLSKEAQGAKKDVKLGPWEAIRKVFSAEDHKTMSINDKSDLFFYDYSLAPLFVHENYLQVQPHCPKDEVLQRLSQAADSISYGDIIDKRIRSGQAWSLLPMQAMFSSVLPGQWLAGHVAGQIQFPGWLGKNSRAGKMHRLCQEIHAHTRLSTTGSKSSIYLDYAPHLRDSITGPLIRDKADGIEQSLQVLEAYNLLREDLDSLVELSVWPGQRNPTVLIDSKVKAAMTRTYNKKGAALPYAPAAVKRARPRDDHDDFEDDDDDAQDDSDPENDGLIKIQKKKSQHSDSSSTSSDKPSTSKGKSSKGSSTGKGKKK